MRLRVAGASHSCLPLASARARLALLWDADPEINGRSPVLEPGVEEPGRVFIVRLSGHPVGRDSGFLVRWEMTLKGKSADGSAVLGGGCLTLAVPQGLHRVG